MCIACRNRESQHTLIRLQLDGKRAVAYRGEGRSFYLCRDCSLDAKRIRKLIKRFKFNEEEFFTLIKELSTDG